MKSEKYIIGIDGGGTKTHAVIADSKGEILGEHFAGPTNFQIIGATRVTEIIFELIELCCESVNCESDNIASLVVGLSGAGRPAEQRMIAGMLKQNAKNKKVKLKNLVIESDARIALEGAFKGDPGIILIAGTGSIAFGKDAKENIYRVGGWGRILADEGSGYFLGRLGLSAVARQLDGRGNKTSLTSMVAKQFGIKDQTTLIQAVYANEFDIASVAPLVMEAAKNDDVCRMIVELAVMELADHVKVISEKITKTFQSKVKSKIHLSLIGGLLSNDTILASMLRQYISSNLPHMEIISPMASPAYGAVVMGMKDLK